MRIDLAVTLRNSIAKNLYDSVGFQDKRAFSEYIWNEYLERFESNIQCGFLQVPLT